MQKISSDDRNFFIRVIFRGSERWKAGRLNAKPAFDLANFFKNNLFKTYRLKTGTPPRLVGNSINFNKCIVQDGIGILSHFLF